MRDRLGLISLDYSSAEECVRAARGLGLGHVELYLDGTETGQRLDALLGPDRLGGVRVHALSGLVRLAQAEEDLPEQLRLVRHCVQAAAAYGVPNVGFMYGGCATLGRVDARHRFFDRLRPLAEHARDHGVGLLVENVFSRSPAGDLDSVDAALEMLERAEGSVRLNFDPGNFTIGGEEAYPYGFAKLRPYLGGVHLKDVTRFRPDVHGPDPECRPLLDHRRGRHITVPLGDGALNALALARELLADPASPPLMLEPFRGGAGRERWLEVSIGRLEALANGAAP